MTWETAHYTLIPLKFKSPSPLIIPKALCINIQNSIRLLVRPFNKMEFYTMHAAIKESVLN